MYLPNRVRYDELEITAADFIEDYGIAEFPLNMKELIRRMRIPLVPYSGILEQSALSLVTRASQDAFHIAPATYDITRMGVYYDPHQIEERIRMSLAHELAHILCEHPNDDEPYESEAKYLASYLLAPTPLVIECTDLELYEVMEKFGVSQQCALIRIERARRRISYGAPYMDHERRIIRSCRDWIGGEMPPRMKRGA